MTSKANILIVDDSPTNIRILANALMADYEIMAAISGMEAIEIAQAHSPELILLDIAMPEMNGYEVCRRLKAEPRTQDIPVIFITAITEEEGETKGFEVGAVDYIRKPFSTGIVKSRISNHLDLKRHRDHLQKLNTLLKQEVSERRRSEEALKHLLKKQEITIDLAKNILNLVNGIPPRYIDLPGGLKLFVETISIPCYAEGGDHSFVRTFDHAKAGGYGKTIVSLKDQSGHEVSCVLRSIITDLIHHTILHSHASMPVENVVSNLNNQICQLSIFNKDDFFTSIIAELDHETLILHYVSAGHPPFLLIRGKEVIAIPSHGQKGANIPIAVIDGLMYSSGEHPLQSGDRLIFYTDGLTEMPLKNTKKMIMIDELVNLVAGIVHHEPKLTVSELIHNVLCCVSGMCQEEVIPNLRNTSDDDVTLIGLEIENWNGYKEEIWKPRNSEELSRCITVLCENLKDEWNQYGYESPETRIRMVLEEAAFNAWIHGNRRNPDKSITVRWGFGNDFHLEMIDEGEGFDPIKVKDPRLKDCITKPCGRGVFIIRHFSDAVTWKNNGRHIIVNFKKHSNPLEKDIIHPPRRLMDQIIVDL